MNKIYKVLHMCTHTEKMTSFCEDNQCKDLKKTTCTLDIFCYAVYFSDNIPCDVTGLHLHFIGHLCFLRMSSFFEVVCIFRVMFIFGVILIFGIVLILESSSFLGLSSFCGSSLLLGLSFELVVNKFEQVLKEL